MRTLQTGAALAVLAVAIMGSSVNVHAAEGPADAPADAADEAIAADSIVVTGTATTYSNTQVTAPMLSRQSALTSVNDVLNELPGVLVTEGDSFGSADWATSITIRGFTSNGGTQQIGSTIDDIPNGGSSYGGGSRANRYLDVLNLGTIQVSQGTSDIASRSNEALGGTLNYVTSDPEQEQRLRFTVAGGDFSAKKFYVRYDTGEIAPGTYAWISGSSSRVHDWIDGSGHTRRDHVAGKFISDLGNVDLTGYVSYDDADESEYASVSKAGFLNNPNQDGLVGNWTGIPVLDQNYRSGSRALRKNLLGYLKAKIDLGEVKLALSGYGHKMRGRGDWLPPYLVDVTNDGAGEPNSEYLGGSTVYGGSALGKIYYVTPTGATAPLLSDCDSTTSDVYQPACYASGSIPVMSYRHTHYRNRRVGFMADVNWTHDLGGATNLLRAGIWYENGKSKSIRDWHKISNALVGYAYDGQPYYVQYATDYGVDEFTYYAEDALTFGPVTARVGVKQYFLTQDRQGLLTGNTTYTKLTYHSDPLLSVGLNYTTPIDGLEIFGGFSQNFAAVGKGLLDAGKDAIKAVKPETADNIEVGARYTGSNLQASFTFFDISFDNRIANIASNLVTGIDYLSETDSVYLNVGGVHSYGVEAALSYRVTPQLTLSGSYTYNRAKYRGTGDTNQDADIGIVPGKQVFNTPKNMYVLSADWKGDIIKAGIATKFVGDRFIDTKGSAVADSFVLTNAYVGASLRGISDLLKNADLTVTVTNLTDERYMAGADGGSAFLGSPRTVTAALTFDF
ncbi:MAG: TonB-dependent receptor [Sphingobium sp.]